jgi:hypothetical protein
MGIGDLYRKKLSQANNFRRMAEDESHTELSRSHFGDRAFNLEAHASYLAHCLALFGDMPLPAMDIEKCLIEVEDMTCEESNPWARGLAVIKEEISVTGS